MCATSRRFSRVPFVNGVRGPTPSELGGDCGNACGPTPHLQRSLDGDPVNDVSGSFFESQTDMSIAGRGVGLDLVRWYDSQAAASGVTGPFGPGWTFSFGDRLKIDAMSGNATLTSASGQTVRFWPDGSGGFDAQPWVQASLVKSGTDYIYTLPNQVATTFDSAGKPTSVVDRNGNTTSLTYSSGKLTMISDPAGRDITLSYTGDLITGAEDPAGNDVTYTYTSGRLTSVEDVTEEMTHYAL